MKRRNLIEISATAIITWLTGCQTSSRSDSTTTKSHTKSMDISPTVLKTTDGWTLKVVVANEDDWDASFYDVRLLAYAVNGTKVCDVAVGDLASSGDFQQTVKTECSAFPAIITASSRESPCENALIPVLRWTGTDAQRKQTVSHGEWPWNSTYRKCGENLPPERVLTTIGTTTGDNR